MKKKNPVRITDVTFRDGQQSLIATRMQTKDMEGIAAEVDKLGFYSAEVWGGATFDVAIRFLNEDPWERVRILKRLMPNTPLQMLLRGQNVVGYRNYPDDVVTAFVQHAAQTGIDIFRVFDSLNDERNLETSFRAVKASGKHVQAQLLYSLTEPKLGGPLYRTDYFVKKARIMQEMGADSLAIVDASGLPCPYDAYQLIKEMKKVVTIPIGMHSHCDSAMASMSYLKAIEAGLDIIDTAFAPFALRSSLPPTEIMVFALQGTPRDTGLDLPRLVKTGQYFEPVIAKYKEFMDQTRVSLVDTEALLHQLPGGLITNLLAQLRQLNVLDRLDEILAEIPQVRKDLGYPVMATPSSQIIVTQAVQNVIAGRYKVMSRQIRDYAYGLYGKSPAPMNPEVQKRMLKNYEGGETPIDCRPADILKPELEKAEQETRGIARDMGDVLTYALYPDIGMRFLKQKYGLEMPPQK
ncbi:MAG: pyruvate carboxylase subunit B [Deltaproteobacteria bacterium]|nr:pyruvate carboxylase subunit B [Deltaproteobacteria bacterium]